MQWGVGVLHIFVYNSDTPWNFISVTALLCVGINSYTLKARESARWMYTTFEMYDMLDEDEHEIKTNKICLPI